MCAGGARGWRPTTAGAATTLGLTRSWRSRRLLQRPMRTSSTPTAVRQKFRAAIVDTGCGAFWSTRAHPCAATCPFKFSSGCLAYATVRESAMSARRPPVLCTGLPKYSLHSPRPHPHHYEQAAHPARYSTPQPLRIDLPADRNIHQDRSPPLPRRCLSMPPRRAVPRAVTFKQPPPPPQPPLAIQSLQLQAHPVGAPQQDTQDGG